MRFRKDRFIGTNGKQWFLPGWRIICRTSAAEVIFNVYLNGAEVNSRQQQEQNDWAALRSLQGALRHIDDTTREGLLQAVERASNLAVFMRTTSEHMIEFSRPLYLPKARPGHDLALRTIKEHPLCKKLSGAV